MTRARLDSFLLFLFGCAVFVGLGVFLARISLVSQVDFKCLYYGSRCFLNHCDPYRAGDLLRVYQAAAADHPADTASIGRIVVTYVNLPTTLIFAAPFALLPWGPAHALWMTLTAACFILAAFLMWRQGAAAAPGVSGALIFLLLAGSELLVEVGNDAGLAVAFCVIAVWCFVQDRAVWAGTLCFALSLLLKPHVTGPVLLYFLLSGAGARKKALRTIAVTAALGLPALLWIDRAIPAWSAEMHANLRAITAPGGVNDPGLAALHATAHGSALVNVQTLLALLGHNPRFYNPAAYLLCLPLLAVWVAVTLRRRHSSQSPWVAIAAVALLSMLPLYHRQHDTRLLLLLVPAMAALWARGGRAARLGLAITAACALLTGDIAGQFLAVAAAALHLSARGWPGRLADLCMTLPAPLILCLAAAFYLWAYARAGNPAPPAAAAAQEAEPLRT